MIGRGKGGGGYNSVGKDSAEEKTVSEFEICSFFVTTDNGIVLHDRYLRPSEADAFIGVVMPFHYFMKRPDPLREDRSFVMTKTSRDFIGIEDANADTVKAIADLSFHLTIGNMDEAFK
ncbi:hypothetical protein BDK51DRAFT_29392, partial [Blyttiomyces helicus]